MKSTVDSPDQADPDRMVPVGRVIGPWGVRGWLKVEPFGGSLHSVLLHAMQWWVVGQPRGGVQAVVAPARMAVQSARRHGASVVAQWAGLTDPEAVQRFKGAEIQVPRAAFPTLPEGEFYWVDLIGCAVRNQEGVDLGRVLTVVDHGAHPILETDRQALIPFVDAYVLDVDVTGRSIRVDWQLEWGL